MICEHYWVDRTEEYGATHRITHNGMASWYEWRECVKCKRVEYRVNDFSYYSYGGDPLKRALCSLLRSHQFTPISVHIEGTYKAMNGRGTGYTWSKCMHCGMFIRHAPEPRSAVWITVV